MSPLEGQQHSDAPSYSSVPPTAPQQQQQPVGSMMRRSRPQPLARHYHGDADGCLDSGMKESFPRGGSRASTTVGEPKHRANRSLSMDDMLHAMLAYSDRQSSDPRSRVPAPPEGLRRGGDGDDVNKTEAMNGELWDDDEDDDEKHLTLKQRMRHVTWAWFTITMATGGIANVLNSVPYRFPGLYAIGVIFFLLNIVLYILIWGMIIARFVLYPWTFRESFTHPTESLFAPAFAVSFGTILINIVQYGFDRVGEWLNRAVLILFWFDSGVAIVLSIAIYLVLWSTQTFTISRMTPIWIFPAYPLLIIGPHAASLSARMSNTGQAIRVLVGGFTIQGIGFLVSLTIYSAFVYRLMTHKLPAEPLRPGMFVSVGPSAFTVSGTIGMAKDLQRVIASSPSSTFMDVPGDLAASILRLVANWMSLWLWGLAWWFFFVSLVSNVDCLRENHRMPFAMTWFSFVFPQTALTTATFAIAEAFDVDAIRIIGCVMTCLVIVVWFIVVGFMIRAIYNKQILWPDRGEDKSEGGFKGRNDGTLLSAQSGNAATGANVCEGSSDHRRKDVSGDDATRNV